MLLILVLCLIVDNCLHFTALVVEVELDVVLGLQKLQGSVSILLRVKCHERIVHKLEVI